MRPLDLAADFVAGPDRMLELLSRLFLITGARMPGCSNSLLHPFLAVAEAEPGLMKTCSNSGRRVAVSFATNSRMADRPGSPPSDALVLVHQVSSRSTIFSQLGINSLQGLRACLSVGCGY